MPTKPRTAAQQSRRAFLLAPIRIQVVAGRSHGGTIIHADVPVRGQRSWVNRPWDETMGTYKRRED